MSKQTWLIFSAVVIIGLGALIYFSRSENIDVSSVDLSVPIITEEQVEEFDTGLKDRIYGNPEAETTMVVYADFSCPGCAAFNERLMGVLDADEYKDNVRMIHRHFPIKSIHPNSFSAAAYAEAIALQDEDLFFEFTDRLYLNQQAWSAVQARERDEQILSFASGLDVDLDQVRQDAQNTEVARKINFDIAVGKANGVAATPTIFLNGEQTDANVFGDAESLREALDASIEEHQSNNESEDAVRREEDSKDESGSSDD